MKKLIKLSDTHYIVVDDSEIKKGDYCLSDNEILQMNNSIGVLLANQQKEKYGTKTFFKITHSTQPLSDKPHYAEYGMLTLSEVEEGVNGYSVEKMAENYYNTLGALGTEYDKTTSINLIIWGFKAHQKLVKDKLFSKENLWWAYVRGFQANEEKKEPLKDFEDVKQSLILTEWDIEIDEQGKITLI